MPKPVKNKAVKQKKEIRTTVQGSRLEARETPDGKTLVGYAVVFNSPADIGGSFTEYIAPGSFTRTLKDDDQVMLRDHESSLLLARKSAGTLKLWQDSTGVAFKVSLPNTALGQDTYENVRLGNLKGCSFGFFVRHDVWSEDSKGKLTRVIDDVKCFEVTLTTFPAYEATSVDLRSIREKLKTKRKDDDLDDLDNDQDGDDNDDDQDGVDEEDRCECDCEACEQGDCSGCTSEGCDDEDCLDNECPMQDDERTRKAHFQLLLRRLR